MPISGRASAGPFDHELRSFMRLQDRTQAPGAEMKRSKSYRAAAEKIGTDKFYTPLQAVRLAKTTTSTKYDSTVEVAMRMGIDPRKADQMVRGTVNLPHGTGKTARVLVFATGERAEQAKAAGADYVGSDDLLAKVAGGWLDFDSVVATPDLMGQVGGLGRVLGPRGLMPNPKTGTVTMDVAKAVSEFKGGRVEYRTDKIGNVQLRVGKVSFSRDDLVRNVQAVIDEIVRVKPSSAKGRYVLSATVSSTMGPGVKIDPSRSRDNDEVLATA